MFLPEIDSLKYHKDPTGRRYSHFSYTEPGGNKKTGKAATRPVRFPKDLEITSLAEAKRQAKAWLDAQQVAQVGDTEVPTLNDVLDAWVNVDPAKRGEFTATYYANLRWRKAHGTRPVTDLTAEFINTATAGWLAEGFSPTTVRAELNYVKWALGRAKRKGLLPADYEVPDRDEVRSPKAKVRENFLMPEDEQQLWDYSVSVLEDPNTTPIHYATALWTCCAMETAGRAEAVSELRWDNGQIDLTRRLLHLQPPGRAQTSKTNATVMISDRLLPVLRKARLKAGGRGPLFVGGTDYWQFTEHYGKSGCVNPRCSRHDLRRTWATLKAMAGADLYVIAKVLGDSLAMVEKHYAKFWHSPRVLEQMNLRPAVDNVVEFAQLEAAE